MIPKGFYHVTPLHYVPYLLKTGALYSQQRLAAIGLPIVPRPSAKRRDRRLHVDSYVHLSLTAITPLLIDKRRRGYPHALLEFGSEIAGISGAAFLKYNTKAWRHRDDFAPISEPSEVAELLAAWQRGRYPSAELLVPESLPLAGNCRRILFASGAEAARINEIVLAANLLCAPLMAVAPDAFPPMSVLDFPELNAYFDLCIASGTVLPPPDLPFD